MAKLKLINIDFVPQLTHKVNRLAYGDFFPGVVNPLDGYFFYTFPTAAFSDILLQQL